jgi:IS30 family transposase
MEVHPDHEQVRSQTLPQPRFTGRPVRQEAHRRPAGRGRAASAHRHWEGDRKFETITFDNGTEFHDYKKLEQRFPITVYFATPYHSWQRGTNENFNGLLRQYLPKGSCMSAVTQARCDHIADDLNNRPRKRHGFSTPTELYHRN